MSTRIRGYGLDNLIANVEPTFVGWDTDPTDAANIVDGNPHTECATGSTAIAGAGVICSIIWTFPESYVMCTGAGTTHATAGTSKLYMGLRNNGSWINCASSATFYDDGKYVPMMMSGGLGTGIRLSLTSTAAATITPHIGEFCVWKVA